MKMRPYLTFDGTCEEAINLYKKAFQTDTLQLVRFSDMPQNPDFQIPDEYQNRILQATIEIGNDYIRVSDCGPNQSLHAPESERISLAIETDADKVRQAFAILAEEGRIAMPLTQTVYSPCAGVVFDKFGVLWNFVGKVEKKDDET